MFLRIPLESVAGYTLRQIRETEQGGFRVLFQNILRY